MQRIPSANTSKPFLIFHLEIKVHDDDDDDDDEIFILTLNGNFQPQNELIKITRIL